MEDFIDDPRIQDGEVLYRRIAPSQIKLEAGIPGISGSAFRTQQMSVNLASRTTPQRVLERYPDHSLAAFTAGLARSLGCIVASDKDDPTHVLVCRKEDPSKSLTNSQAYNIAKQAKLIVFKVPSQ